MEIKKEGYSIVSKDPVIAVLVVMFVALSGILFGTFEINSQVVYDEKPFFNINIEIPRPYKESTTEVLTIIKLVNLAGQEKIDVVLDYTIESRIGNVVLKKGETVAIETQASLVRYFTLPDGLPPGIYFVKVLMSSLDGKPYAVASDSFDVLDNSNVITKQDDNSKNIANPYWWAIFVFLVASALIYRPSFEISWAKRKIQKSIEEQNKITAMQVDTEKKYYKEGRITKKEFRNLMEKYEERLAKANENESIYHKELIERLEKTKIRLGLGKNSKY